MDVLKEIEECTHKIIQNQAEECQWNDKILRPMDFESWKEILLQRSMAIRSFFTENEEYIQKLKSYYQGPLDRVTADALFEAARAMLLQGRMDPALICDICNPLMDYYIAENIEDKAIIISMIRNSCMQDYFNRMLPDYNIQSLEKSLLWIISKKDKYCSYSDVRARRNILHAYSNLIMMYLQTESELGISNVLKYFDEVNALWNRPEVQALDGNDPQTSAIVDEINYYVPLELDIAPNLRGPVINKAMQLLARYYESHRGTDEWDIKIILQLIKIREKEYRREINSPDAVKQLMTLIEQLPTPEWEEDIAAAQSVFQLYTYAFISAMKIMTRTGLPAYDCEQITLKMLQSFRKIVQKLPYEYLTSYVNDVFRNIFSNALPNLTTLSVKENLLYEFLIRRQPSTYLHSQMVEQIALIVAEEMLAKEPELFLSLPGYSDIPLVLRDKDTLLHNIALGARLHDTGKCCIASVIMRQSRKLTDDEFLCIKSHPDLGMSFFENEPDFAMYSDIIRGHHKTYDGMGGYPAAFDNTASPYRILIDLISICDATDAATDITGRNYTPGKDFQKLLDELIEGAGKRYNPDIVRIIASSPQVIEKITELTGPKRISYCYKAYRECLHFD